MFKCVKFYNLSKIHNVVLAVRISKMYRDKGKSKGLFELEDI